MLCEMQSTSSRIWTRIAVSISCDDNHYTTGSFRYMWLLKFSNIYDNRQIITSSCWWGFVYVDCIHSKRFKKTLQNGVPGIIAYWPLIAECASRVNNEIAGCNCINKRKISGSSHVVEQKCMGVVKWYMKMPTWDTVSLAAVSSQSAVLSLGVLQWPQGARASREKT